MHILAAMQQHITSRAMFLLALNIFLLIVGSLMDIFSAIVVVVPLITPIAAQFGVHPLHLGIIFLTNLEIGYSHPPSRPQPVSRQPALPASHHAAIPCPPAFSGDFARGTRADYLYP